MKLQPWSWLWVSGLKAPIYLYRWFISPLLSPNCRFMPSCSAYALEAIDKHGSRRGLVLSAKRLMRCHPGCPGGYDPVPEVTGSSLSSNKSTS